MAEPFLWGAATSAHQVEGNNVKNDWWAWEKETPGIQPSGRAADHYQRYAEDFGIAQKLGHNAHRLSIEWSRIEPESGKWSRSALDHYSQVLEELKSQGLKSFVTLHHFTNPNWLAKEGGWVNRRTPEKFARYVDMVVQRLGHLVDYWITINEPMVYASQSYWRGRWPPQKKNGWLTWRVVSNMARGHRLAYRTIHRHLPAARVGMAKHWIGYLDGQRIPDFWFNDLWYELTRGRHDFVGLNYYFSSSKQEWTGPVSDMDWPIRPEGFRHVLKQAARLKKPIYVTENGLADRADIKRADFIRGHVKAMRAAMRDGADVRGYLHWSLLDNFEWDHGFEPRFGLVKVDYQTMKRTVRDSAQVLKAFANQD